MSENEIQAAAEETAAEPITEVTAPETASEQPAATAENETPQAAAEETAVEASAETTDTTEAAVEVAPEAPAEPEVPAEPEEISYHAVEKEGNITAIWEMQGEKHIRTIDPRSTEGQKIFSLFTSDIHETDSPPLANEATSL